MRVLLVFGCWLCLAPAAFGAPSAETAPLLNLPELQQHFESVISQPKYDAALWGVKVVSLDTGKTLFEHNAQKLFSPASNSKLYTVALGLARLGADYRIKTTLYARNKPDSQGLLAGDLIVYGRGDPTLNSRLHHNDIFEALEPLVALVTNAGIRQITGDLVADESFFEGPEFGSGWMWDDLEYDYGAEISALTVNDNVMPVTVGPGSQAGAPCRLSLDISPSTLMLSNRTITVEKGGARTLHFFRPLEGNLVYVTGQMPLQAPAYKDTLPMHRPAEWFASLFREALRQHGVEVKGKSRTVNWLDHEVDGIDCKTLVDLGSTESPPVSELAREIEKPSQNLYTDLLLAHVGENARPAGTNQLGTSEDLGIAELQKFLKQAGVKPGEVQFEEGSGLSRDNLTTPNATVTLLAYMSRHQYADAYVSALPVAGRDGTLRNRMKGTAAEGNVRAKTGTLRWATSLSGYVTTAAGERLAFSLMLNRFHATPGAASGRGDIDSLAVALAKFAGRTGS